MKKEIGEGVGGNGNTIYLVITWAKKIDGRKKQWHWVEYFKNKSEAECWLKWA